MRASARAPTICNPREKCVARSEVRYLLVRLRAHRRLWCLADCPEARLIHLQFVKSYQRQLAAHRGSAGPQPDHDGRPSAVPYGGGEIVREPIPAG